MVLHSPWVRCACTGLVALSFALACAGCGLIGANTSSATADDTKAMVESALSNADIDVKDVAAVVSGRIVTQQEVDDAVEAQRVRLGLTDDGDWSDYLASSGSTEWDVRAGVIEEMVDDILIELKADELGIDITPQVDERVETVENLYPSHAAFLSAIASKGYTEETYRDGVRSNLLREALQGMVIETPTPTDEEVGQYAVVVAPLLVGKRSSAILVSSNDYSTVLEVKQKLDAGADFAELATEYSIDSTAANGGDAGWDSLNTFVTPYQNALSQLEVGEVSDIVRTRFGYYIIKCTERYDAPTDAEGSIDISAIPDSLMDWIVDSISHTLASQMFDVYLDNLEATVPIAVFDAEGNQVTNAEAGLATESSEVPSSSEVSVDDVIADAQDSVQKATDDGVPSIKDMAAGEEGEAAA